MQRTVGNRAVSQASQSWTIRTPRWALYRPAPSPPRETDEQLFDEAVKVGDWATAARLLVILPLPASKLPGLSVEQLRMLQDGLIRARKELSGTGLAVEFAIFAALQAKGVTAARVGAGAAFGTLAFTVIAKRNGGDGGVYAYEIDITFLPDKDLVEAKAVNADEIAFIQTVRLVDNATGANRDLNETSRKRHTATNTGVDRLAGREQGWYGTTNAGLGSASLRAWTRLTPKKPAYMTDTPAGSTANTSWEFETAVVCRSGPDAGKVYATLTWGFTVDADMKLVEKDPVVTNKPSAEFSKAIERWNAQAAGPLADRNAPGQKPLPTVW